MGSPTHQHFIPRSYLKYFGEKKGDNYFVDTLMRGDNGKIVQLPIKNICVQKNLYTFPVSAAGDRFALEKFYASEVDAVYPEVYNMLTNPNISIIGAEDKRKIINTVLSLFFRTPHFLNDKNDGLDEMLDQLIDQYTDPEADVAIGYRGEQQTFKMKDIEEVRAELKGKHKVQFLISHFGEWQDFINYKMNCGIQVMTVPEDVPLITCDNPVLIMEKGGMINSQNIFSPNNIIEFPINRNQYVFIHPNSTADGAERRISRANRDKRFAAGVNLCTEENSMLRLVSYPGDMEIHFRSQQELNQVNAENLQAEADMHKKVKMANELLEVVTRHGVVSQHTANKVKEIRQTKLMDDDVMLQQLIGELVKNGYLTV